MELLIHMTIAGTVTAAMLLLLRAAFQSRMPLRWQCALWLILAVRLVLPVFPESEISIFNMIRTPAQVSQLSPSSVAPVEGEIRLQTKPSSETADSDPALPGNIPLVHSAVEPFPPLGADVDDAAESHSIPDSGIDSHTPTSLPAAPSVSQSRTLEQLDRLLPTLLPYLWAFGTVVMLAVIWGSSLLFWRQLQRYPLCKEEQILFLLRQCESELGLPPRLEIRMGGRTPTLAGLFHPTLLLPAAFCQKAPPNASKSGGTTAPDISREELRCILLHELSHLKGKHLWINAFSATLLCVYWYHPLLWICRRLAQRDLELLCDQTVLERTQNPKQYASVLLKTASGNPRLLFTAAALQNGENEVKKRILRMASFKQPKTMRTVAVILLTAVVGTLCLTDALAKDQPLYAFGNNGDYMVPAPKGWEIGPDYDGQGDLVFYQDKREIARISEVAWQEGASLPGVPQQRTDLVSIGPGNSWYVLNGLPMSDHQKLVEAGMLDVADVIGGQPGSGLQVDGKTAFAQIETQEAQETPEAHRFHVYLVLNEVISPAAPTASALRAFDIRINTDTLEESRRESAKEHAAKLAASIQEVTRIRQIHPAIPAYENWDKDAKLALEAYLDHYAAASLPVEQAISGYRIRSMKRADNDPEQTIDWNALYPNTVIYQIDYDLEPLYPEFFIGETACRGQYATFYQTTAVNGTGGTPYAQFGYFLSDDSVKWFSRHRTAANPPQSVDPSQLMAAPDLLLHFAGTSLSHPDSVRAITSSLPYGRYVTDISRTLEKKDDGWSQQPWVITYDFDQESVFRSDQSQPAESGFRLNQEIDTALHANAAILLSLAGSTSSDQDLFRDGPAAEQQFTIKVLGTLAETGQPRTLEFSVTMDQIQKQYPDSLADYRSDPVTYRDQFLKPLLN